MKSIFISLLLAGSISVQAQNIKEWLALTPVAVEKPALSEIQNVREKTFTDAMLAEYDGMNIHALHPCQGRQEGSLQWTVAQMEQDTAIAPAGNGKQSLCHFASYISNPDWISGQLEFQLFGPAEIYIDGEKKAATTEMGKTTKAIPVEWIPGKHTLIVKSLSSGGKTLYARFKADKEFAGEDVRFSLSPKRGKCIYDVLNGKNVSRLYLSDSGKYALIGITNTSDGKTNANTYVYRVADKEIVYTFYGNTISNLQWIPGKDALSFLISECIGRSLLE